MSMTPIEDSDPALPYDDALRWIIPSRTNPHESYVVELNASPGYSVCQCMHFQCRILPLLSIGMTPEEAVQKGLVKLKPHQRIEDALKCDHIWAPGGAEHQLAIATVKAFTHARTSQTAKEKHLSA